MSGKGKRLNPFQHALERPDTYIGSIVTTNRETQTHHNGKIVTKRIKYNPGMFKCYEEIISNAIDNKWRSDEAGIEMSKIIVTADRETNEITVLNDGLDIPAERMSYEYTDPVTQKVTTDDLYPAELYFGYMLSGTNYDDSEDRKTSGKNGMGSKACNVFSKQFIIEHVDKDGRKFVQVYKNNLTERSTPKITKTKVKPYTKISFILDFERFKYPGIDDDLENLIHKTCFDTAMITNLPVTFNKSRIRVPDLTKYAKLYYGNTNMMHLSSDSGEVVMVDIRLESDDFLSADEPKHVSFVNGCYTKDGGVHVDAWRNAMVTPFVKKFNDKKKVKTTAKDVYPYIAVFVKCELDKPSFDSQTKDRLNSPKPTITNPTAADIDKMLKWPFVASLIEKLEMKNIMKLEAKEKKTTKRKTFGDKADDANEAGGSKAMQCTLYITEGLSAKSFVTSGKSAIPNGHDFIGAMALKGKLINVRNAPKKQVLENTEVGLIKDILGLRVGMDYRKDANFKTLRYGKVNILTDADDDGIHIRGLVLNFFYELYPTLVERGDFLEAMSTYVAVAKKGKTKEVFYSNPQYKRWEDANTDKKVDVKYYKGLGTSRPEDAKACFKDPQVVKYVTDGDEEMMMSLAFDKDETDERKRIICEERTEKDFVYQGSLSLSNFVNDQLIIYLKMCISRAVPSYIDGFKESQRKVFFGITKSKLKKSMDLERLAGAVKNITGYHHGGVSLQNTIVKMAQGFVGSNNIPLLIPDGQFGTRLMGGEDAAAPRYISTKLEEITKHMFSEIDYPLLEYRMEDNLLVEPKYFIPILPIVLINGAEGIASGYSTKIPCYNPVDIIRWINVWLKDRSRVAKLDPLKPWYRNFTGEIDVKGIKWSSTGRLQPMKKKNWWVVDELPIGVWTNKFKACLDDMINDKKTKNTVLEYKEYNTGNSVKFEIRVGKDFTPDIKANMKILHKNGSMSNMWLIDENGVPVKFNNPEEILDKFCHFRFGFYEKRKEYLERVWKIDLQKAENRFRFIRDVKDRKIDLYKEEEELEKELSNFDKVDDSYDYLLSIQMRSMTKKRMDELEKEIDSIKNKLENMQGSSASDLWMNDLTRFYEEYKKFLKTRTEE